MVKVVDALTMKEAGRKFRAFLICLAAASGALVGAAYVPALLPILPAYLTAIGGFLTVYLTGNIAHHHVTMKNNQVETETVLEPGLIGELDEEEASD
jgi:hypothetical protein